MAMSASSTAEGSITVEASQTPSRPLCPNWRLRTARTNRLVIRRTRGRGADAMQHGPQRVLAGVDRAADAAVGVAGGHHQLSEVLGFAAISAASTAVIPLARRRSWYRAAYFCSLGEVSGWMKVTPGGRARRRLAR